MFHQSSMTSRFLDVLVLMNTSRRNFILQRQVRDNFTRPKGRKFGLGKARLCGCVRADHLFRRRPELSGRPCASPYHRTTQPSADLRRYRHGGLSRHVFGVRRAERPTGLPACWRRRRSTIWLARHGALSDQRPDLPNDLGRSALPLLRAPSGRSTRRAAGGSGHLACRTRPRWARQWRRDQIPRRRRRRAHRLPIPISRCGSAP